MRYGADWTPPWRTTDQVRCAGPNCNQGDLPGDLVMACTVDDKGYCASCARSADDDSTRLRMEMG